MPGGLRFRYGVLEVISTLLLNFVAEALVSFMVQRPLQESQHIYPQSDPISVAARLPVFPGTRLHVGILLALSCCVLAWYVFRRTLLGFQLRAVGRGRGRRGSRAGCGCKRLGAMRCWCRGTRGPRRRRRGERRELRAVSQPFTGLRFHRHRGGVAGPPVAGGDRRQCLLFGALEAGAGAMQRDAGVPAVAVYVAEAVTILAVLLADAVSLRRRDAVTA